MIPIVQTLKDSGYHCRIVPLRFGQALEPERVAENWVSSIAAAFGESATLVGEPRYCVAYSLGALVTLTFLQRAPEAFFDRLFLIAPPLVLTKPARLVNLLTPFHHLGWALPSLAPEEIRANSSTTLTDYKAMLILIRDLDTGSVSANIRRIDTKVILRADDELVESKGVEDWVKKRGLDWDVLMLQSGPQPKHLLLSEARMGSDAWRTMTGTMLAHFASYSTAHHQ